MCGENLAFWYCVLFLLVISSLKSQQNFIGNEEKNDNLTLEYWIDTSSVTNYADAIKKMLYYLYEKFINNTQYDMQYEYRTTFMSNDSENDDWKQWIEEFYENITETENSNKDKNTSYIIPYESCIDIICIQLCCPLGYRLDYDDECILEKIKYIFPNVYEYMNDSLQSINKTVNEFVPLTAYDPCQYERGYPFFEDKYTFFANGSLYLSDIDIFVKSTSYCLDIAREEDRMFEMKICSETLDEINGYYYNLYYDIYDYIENNEGIRLNYYIVSIPFLMSIFVVYFILPELRNEHGFMLCNYSGALSVAYITDFIPILIEGKRNDVDVYFYLCFIVAFHKYLFFLASFFWLNIMSFDMWWTFRGFSSLQRNVKQRKKKKLVFYSIFAWSLSFILAIISVIMNIVSLIFFGGRNLVSRIEKCNFTEAIAFTPYYYGLQSICIISNICLSISTALKIARYEKETGNRLTNLESRKHNDNKKWFNLYLKLFILQFILMGIKWSMMTILSIFKYLPLRKYKKYFICIILLVDIMQNVCTFIVFVWKREIKRMLLKRFGCGFRCAINATSPST
ncbi:G-protein coupled receptor Mth2 [Formica fusca]